MHFTSYVALAAAALVSVSEALPAYQAPAGFTLKYSGLKSLPAVGKEIKLPNNAAPNNAAACASACGGIPACQFFAIYTPLNSNNRQCVFYEQPDPYGGNRATHFTSMVKEACGFAKNQKPAAKVRDLAAEAQLERVPEFQPVIYKPDTNEKQAAPARNGTDGATMVERRFTYPVVYQPNMDVPVPAKRCGLMCEVYLKVRCLWK
ncbi:hypothetical protein TWF696_008596 [Orbilia brochopaga]|uniref:Apple domain-containing protein n=1 Tax=Orbilia brochopaga TaxID=3140254 RepID=A0AAV9UJL1_9PEZI